MSFRRIVGWAVVAVAVRAVVACGDATDATPPVVVTDDGGAIEAGRDSAVVEASGDSSAPPQDAGSEEAEAIPPGACGTEKGPTSNSCQFDRACSADECPADSIVVQCALSGGGTRPPIDGCKYMGAYDGAPLEEWCCPRTACVRRVTNDSSCKIGETFSWCPTFDSGASIAPAGCRRVAVGTTYDGYCCP